MVVAAPLFRLEAVRYKTILDISRLQLGAVQVTALLGPSGSGKTTLLKLLNRLLSPDSGGVTYKEQDLSAYDPVELRRRVVMLGQTAVMFPGTVRDNLVVGLRFHGRSAPDDNELNGRLAAMGLNLELDRLPESLSGGECARLALARALLLEPEVLLLDEPTSSLDKATAHRVVKHAVEGAAQQATKVIMVTHSETIATEHAQTIVRLRDGCVQDGSS
ncbi:MAG: ATP-binding cassette domain-containing protein [Spirochaetaceae bacterium]|nr:MAG: ATP-binding cassette domain-containing protein [Spirochaetaceae bacterium]